MNNIGVCIPFSDAGAYAGEMDFVEENVQRLLVPREDESSFDEKSNGAKKVVPPIRFANSFLPAALRSVGPDYDPEGILAYADTAFRRARRLGIRIVVFGSGGSRAIPEGFPRAKAEEQFRALLTVLARVAESHKVMLVVEALNRGECNFINSLAEAAELVRAVDHPSVRLLADIYHMLREDEPPEEIARFASVITHVHLAERAIRSAPGRAGDDFRPFFRALHTAGYSGAFSLECNWQNQREDVPLGLRTLREQLQESGF